MKTILVVCTLVICINLQAQQKKKQVELFTSVDVNQLQHIGGSFSFHPLITPDFSLGAGLDLVKIRDLDYLWTPYYFDTRYYLRGKKIQFHLFVQASPGSVINKKEKRPFQIQIESEQINRSFLGVGAGFSLGSVTTKVRPFFSAKMRRYQMEDINPLLNTSTRFRQDQFTLSVGINW
jgi:hypothetical protein